MSRDHKSLAECNQECFLNFLVFPPFWPFFLLYFPICQSWCDRRNPDGPRQDIKAASVSNNIEAEPKQAEKAALVSNNFEYDIGIYCVRNRDDYEELKQVKVQMHQGMRPIEVLSETCQDLLQQCVNKFGTQYQCIQAGFSSELPLKLVKASGGICQHLDPDDYNY